MNGLKNGFTHTPLHTQSVKYEDVERSVEYLLKHVDGRPVVGIVCGSGLGGLVNTLEDQKVFNYSDIPNFPVSTVVGHAGRLVFGRILDKYVVCMQGRFHAYEGYSMARITLPIRVMALMGVKKLIVTNASGGLNSDYKVGDVMLVKDHINLVGMAGLNPLVGCKDERFGPRFVPLSDAYSKDLRDLTKKVAKDMDMDYLKEGVYVIQCGPCFETVTECRMLRMMGADVTGMSSVPEVVVARQHGIEVLGLSLVTNMCIMDYDQKATANHEEVLETGRMRGEDLVKFVSRIVELMETKPSE